MYCSFVPGEDKSGYTELHLLCMEDDEDKTKMEALLDTDIDINAKDKNGRSALHLSCFNGKYNFVRRLIKAGADVNAKDPDGYSVLHYAVEGSNGSIIPLVNAGANVEELGKTGDTPLQHACEIGKVGAVEKLCEAGAKTSVLDSNENGLLTLVLKSVKAAIPGNAAKMIRVLAKHEVGAGNIDVKTGDSEINHAAFRIKNSLQSEKAYNTIFNTIVKLGDDPWRINKDGVCALDYLTEEDLDGVKSSLKKSLKGRELTVLEMIKSTMGFIAFRTFQSKLSEEQLKKEIESRTNLQGLNLASLH